MCVYMYACVYAGPWWVCTVCVAGIATPDLQLQNSVPYSGTIY